MKEEEYNQNSHNRIDNRGERSPIMNGGGNTVNYFGTPQRSSNARQAMTSEPLCKRLIGRNDDIKKITDLLTEYQAVVISSEGGIGKTAIAVKIFTNIRKGYDLTGWITYNENMRTSLLKEVKLFESEKDDETRFKKIKEYLRNDEKKLLVIDNFSGEIDVDFKELLSYPNIHIIVTSRFSEELSDYNFEEYQIKNLIEDDCIKMFCYYYNYNKAEVNREEVRNIVKWANYHTLLIEFIAKSAKGENLQTYYTHLQECGFNAIKDKDNKIKKLYDISEFDNNEEIKRILWSFAIMPEKTCITLKEAEKWFNFNEQDLKKLVNSGWLFYDYSSFCYKIYPLASKIIKHYHKDTLPQNVEEHFMQYVGNNYNDFLSFDAGITAGEIGRRIEIVLPFIDYMDDSNSLKGDVCNNIGYAYDDKGEYDEALKYYKKALAIYEAVLGEQHPDTATSYNNIGGVYYSKGEYDESLTYLKKAGAIIEAVLGEKHPFTATSYNNIGNAYADKGEYDEALTYYEKDLAICKEVLGEKHPDTAQSYNNIGVVYYSKGEYDEALKYYKKAVAIARAKLGENHPDTKLYENNLRECEQAMRSIWRLFK